MIIKNLTARTAWACLTHRPKIIFLAKACKPRRVNTYIFQPDVCRLIILFVNGAPQSLRWNSQNFGNKLPSIVNRIVLEIVSETKITHHFKKRVVPSCIAHVLQIIMFTPSANAPLGSHCSEIFTTLLTKENILKLHHAGISK